MTSSEQAKRLRPDEGSWAGSRAPSAEEREAGQGHEGVASSGSGNGGAAVAVTPEERHAEHEQQELREEVYRKL